MLKGSTAAKTFPTIPALWFTTVTSMVSEWIQRTPGLTDEMVSQSPDLHGVLQVFVSQNFSAASVQTTVDDFGNFSAYKTGSTTKINNMLIL